MVRGVIGLPKPQRMSRTPAANHSRTPDAAALLRNAPPRPRPNLCFGIRPGLVISDTGNARYARIEGPAT
jgi:hypothetical protein